MFRDEDSEYWSSKCVAPIQFLSVGLEAFPALKPILQWAHSNHAKVVVDNDFEGCVGINLSKAPRHLDANVTSLIHGISAVAVATAALDDDLPRVFGMNAVHTVGDNARRLLIGVETLNKLVSQSCYVQGRTKYKFDAVIDARVSAPNEYDDIKHVGLQPKQLQMMLEHSDFERLNEETRAALRDAKRRHAGFAKGMEPLTILVFCKGGRNRSVTWAELLIIAFGMMHVPAKTVHLGSRTCWSDKGCCGGCDPCVISRTMTGTKLQKQIAEQMNPVVLLKQLCPDAIIAE